MTARPDDVREWAERVAAYPRRGPIERALVEHSILDYIEALEAENARLVAILQRVLGWKAIPRTLEEFERRWAGRFNAASQWVAKKQQKESEKRAQDWIDVFNSYKPRED